MRTSVLAVLLATVGCAVEPDVVDENAAAVTTSTEVARVTTADGAVWRFLEADPGSLFVWATSSTTGRLDNPALDPQLSYVDLHRLLTTAPVPRSLLDAQARADAVVDEPELDASGLENEASDPSKRTAQVSPEYFQQYYCSNWDYLFCWPEFYGSPFVQRKGYAMSGFVAAVDHTVDFRLRYKKHSYSSWTTLVSAQALPGQVHQVLGQHYAYRRWRRFEVLDNGANLVRYSNHGDD